MSNSKNYCRRRHGYTLIEVLIVLSILAMMFPISTYLLGSLFDPRQNNRKEAADLGRFQSEFSVVRYSLISSSTDNFYLNCRNKTVDIWQKSVPIGGDGIVDKKIGEATFQNFVCATTTSGDQINAKIIRANYPYLLNPISIPLIPQVLASTSPVNLIINKFGFSYLKYE